LTEVIASRREKLLLPTLMNTIANFGPWQTHFLRIMTEISD